MNTAINYSYDEFSRLTNVKVTDRANENNISETSYTYDKVGNRLTETDENGTKTYSYNNLNELLNIKKDDNILTRYTYDKNGNEIKEISGTTVINKQYDINNQMITYDRYEDGKNTLLVDNEYNYNGQRKEKTVATPYQDTGTLVGNPVYYYYSNGSLLYTTNTSNKMLSANILNLEGNVISSTRNDNNFYAYNKDIRNSTSSIVNQYNNGVVTYKYSDFGETEQLVNKEFDNEICYTGGIYDKETGEYYLNARHYDPTIARFTSVDTYRGETEEPATLHLYAYCANNPINFVDPSGHKGIKADRSRWRKIKTWTNNVNMENKYGRIVLDTISLFHPSGTILNIYINGVQILFKRENVNSNNIRYIRRRRWGHKGHLNCTTTVGWFLDKNQNKVSRVFYISRTSYACKFTK